MVAAETGERGQLQVFGRYKGEHQVKCTTSEQRRTAHAHHVFESVALVTRGRSLEGLEEAAGPFFARRFAVCVCERGEKARW